MEEGVCSVSSREASTTQDNKDEDRVILSVEGTRNRYCNLYPIGSSSGLTVHRGVYIADDCNDYRVLGIHGVFICMKFVHVDQDQEAFNKLREEVETNRQLARHENLMEIKKSFIDQERLCVVFPYMDMGSLRSLMAAKFRRGLPEELIIVALKETLIGLTIIHAHDHVHKKINAGHIYFNTKPQIKLGFNTTLYDEHGCSESSSSSILPSYSICEWGAALEVYNTQNLESKASDVWMIGVTALELAYGGIKVSDRESFDAMVKKINETKSLPQKEGHYTEIPKKSKTNFDIFRRMIGRRPSCVVQSETTFTKGFERMVAKCLNWEADKRPSVFELLNYEIFNECNDLDFFLNIIRPPAERKGWFSRRL